jgi:hypothetical protein
MALQDVNEQIQYDRKIRFRTRLQDRQLVFWVW